MKIRKVFRIGLPETNSSSSHSVTISMTNNFQDPKVWNLYPNEDGIIHVPGSISFGWEWEKYNDVLTKLQYVCGIICSNNYDNRVSRSKKLFELKKIIMDFTGAKDVIFDWESEYNKKLIEGVDPEDIFLDCPEIDHNSCDIFSEIAENKNTLKNFIFNPESWLYLGNDNSSAPTDFYGKVEENNTIASIDFGGDVGRIDFNIPEFPCKVFEYIGEDDEIDLLKNIKIDHTTGKAIIDPIFDKKFDNFGLNTAQLDETDKDLRLSIISEVINGSEYVYYVSNKFKNLWINNVYSEFSLSNSCDSYYLKKGSYLIEHHTQESEKGFKKTLNHLSDSEGIDWMRFKINIINNEFGTI